MGELLLDVLLDSLKDMIFILIALYLTYLLMETIEHYAGQKTVNLIRKSRKLGPLLGALLGAVPECGIAGGVANLYVGGVISVGAFAAAILSTSDEMLAVLISQKDFKSLGLFLAYKIVFGCAAGFAVDFLNFLRKKAWTKRGRTVEADGTICEICERENCMCGHHHHHPYRGKHDEEHHEDECHHKVWLAALVHTLKIGVLVFVVSFILSFLVEWLGEDRIQALPFNMPVVGELIAALFGLIPNCSVSVILSNLYCGGVLKAGPLMAGLLSNGGVGLLVFFRMNRGKGKWKRNFAVVGTVYVLAVLGGLLASLLF